MVEIIDVVYYICHQATLVRTPLSKARLVKLVYLADWKAAIEYGHQITSISWYFNHYGPYVTEIIDVIEQSPLFFKREYTNQFGNLAEEILLLPQEKGDTPANNLSEDDRKIINYVVSITKDMGYTEFLRLIYSTYPIIKSNKFDNMNLEKLAEEYKTYNTGNSHL